MKSRIWAALAPASEGATMPPVLYGFTLYGTLWCASHTLKGVPRSCGYASEARASEVSSVRFPRRGRIFEILKSRKTVSV
eukprot:scaffold72573_cov34-Phaeocystis_antarctica.AAC.1